MWMGSSPWCSFGVELLEIPSFSLVLVSDVYMLVLLALFTASVLVSYGFTTKSLHIRVLLGKNKSLRCADIFCYYLRVWSDRLILFLINWPALYYSSALA